MQEALAVVEQQQPASVLDAIRLAATNPQTNVENMQALLAMQEHIMAIQAKRDYLEAMGRVQADLPAVPKDGVIDLGSKGQIKYARLEDIQSIVNPLLTREGFTTKYSERIIEGPTPLKEVTVTLTHQSGHSESASTHIPASDPGPGRNATQAMVSSNSYGKRRALINILNIQIAGEDDDATGAAALPITGDQVDEIQRRINAKGVDEARFLKWIKAASIAEIRQGDYLRAIDALEQRGR